jgi:hypothetical protein
VLNKTSLGRASADALLFIIVQMIHEFREIFAFQGLRDRILNSSCEHQLPSNSDAAAMRYVLRPSAATDRKLGRQPKGENSLKSLEEFRTRGDGTWFDKYPRRGAVHTAKSRFPERPCEIRRWEQGKSSINGHKGEPIALITPNLQRF